MKTLFRILLILFVLFVITAGLGYFLVTRPAFQKKLIEGQLPEGSSIQFVHITTSRLELTDLELRMPDGTMAKVDSLRSDFSPMAALMNSTIQLRGLTVDGLVVKLPEVSAVDPGSAVNVPSQATTSDTPIPPAASAPTQEASSPMDALYALGEINWLFDLDSVDLNGALIDASRNRFVFDLSSGRIAPGEETTLTLNLDLESSTALQGGLQDFNSSAQLVFLQQKSGGFERLRLETLTEGSDASGGRLLSISQNLSLSLNSFEKTAEFELSFNADLPSPEVFAPELAALQGLSLQGDLSGQAIGDALTLSAAEFDAASNGAQVVSIQLKQSLTLGAEQQFSGELLEANVYNLPLAWINPWLGDGLRLTGAPLTVGIAVSGAQNGALNVRTLTPIVFGPFSLAQNEQVFLQDVSLQMNPTLKVDADQTLHFDLGDFALLDRYGAFVSGSVSGLKKEAEDDYPLTGLQTQAKLTLGLAELLQQPILDGKASVMAGQASIQLNIDGAAEYPAQLQLAIRDLRARGMPGATQNYRLAAQIQQVSNGGLSLGANFAAGSDTNPSTRLQLAGQFNPQAQPLPFKVDLTAPRITQSDLDLLMAAAKAQASPATTIPVSRAPDPNTGAAGRSPQATTATSLRPPWADLDGLVTVQADELMLNSGQRITGFKARAQISEPLLEVTEIAAKLEGGSLGGSGKAEFNPKLSNAYTLTSALNFKDVDPSIFSKKASGSFPVKGLFDGNVDLVGRGTTLEAALQDLEGNVVVTGRDGILTAFDLDERSQLGLLGAGILGQSLNRPGISAMAQTVPYFQNMPFDSFILKLNRSNDKRVRIPELSFIGDNLRINGEGIIAASSLSDLMNQPLDLTLGLGAKGRLVQYLETLGLLQPATSEDGFRNWKQAIRIGGTLGDPDTSALKEILNNAARRALSEPSRAKTPVSGETEGIPQEATPAEGTPPTEPKKRSKEEKRKDDIEMGIDLLNSVFGSFSQHSDDWPKA
jgi:hypothetical protein